MELSEEESEHAVKAADDIVLVCNTATKPARHILMQEIFIPLSDNSTSESFKQAMQPVYESLERDWAVAGSDPWEQLHFSKDVGVLSMPREHCKKCGKSVRVMCPWCVEALHPDLLPSVRLGMRVVALLHPAEPRQGSSIIQASVLCPDIQLVEAAENAALPSLDPQSSVVLYPSEDAKWLDETSIAHVTTVVLIESPWRFSQELAERVRDLPHVKIRNQTATHWRFQPLGKEYLCTVEALYYFLQKRQADIDPSTAATNTTTNTATTTTTTTTMATVTMTTTTTTVTSAAHTALNTSTALASTANSTSSSSSAAVASTAPTIDDILFLYAHQHRNIVSKQQTTAARPLKSWQPRAHRLRSDNQQT